MAESVLIHNVLLADRPSMPRGWVLVEGDTISAVGEGDVPAGTGAAEVVDGRGAFLMPVLSTPMCISAGRDSPTKPP